MSDNKQEKVTFFVHSQQLFKCFLHLVIMIRLHSKMKECFSRYSLHKINIEKEYHMNVS